MRRVGHNVAQPFRLDLTFAHAMAPAPSTPSAPRQTTLATTSAGGLGWKPSTPAVAAATPTASSPGFGWQSATTPVRPGFQAPTKAAAAAVAWGAPQANAAWGAPQADAARTSVAVPTTTAPATTAAAVDLTGTRTPVAKLLLLVSHLFKRGSLTPAQRAALKQRVMSGDPALLAVLECFEVDADLGELLDSMRALSSQ
jgi:hypothetical protein